MNKLIYVDLPNISNRQVNFIRNILLIHGGRALTTGHLTASSSIGVLRPVIGANLRFSVTGRFNFVWYSWRPRIRAVKLGRRLFGQLCILGM